MWKIGMLTYELLFFHPTITLPIPPGDGNPMDLIESNALGIKYADLPHINNKS